MYRFVTALSVLLVALPVLAGGSGFGPGSDGDLDCDALFALNPDCGPECTETCTVEISLALAEPGDWDTTPHEEGVGVYDQGEWAVVYQYITIDIPEFVTVRFVNHLKGAPVVWLATGDVNIAGTVELNGANGSTNPNSPRAIPGPGGFSGGSKFREGSAGFGPGGGSFVSGRGGGGGYGDQGGGTGGGAFYGTESIVPLIGGSGGSFGNYSNNICSGGAGGGAILIASSGNISLVGIISANGGDASCSFSGGSGSGGGIRLIANDTISGSGLLEALGGGPQGNMFGGVGRIRLEAPDVELTNPDIMPTPSIVLGEPGPVFPGTPGEPAPILRVTAIDGLEVPTDPLATVATGDVALTSNPELDVTIEIELLNLLAALGSTVEVRIVEADGGFSQVVFSDPLEDGGPDRLITSASLNLDPAGKWEVQLTVLLP